MKIGLYSHNIDFAGTWRSHERIAEILQTDPAVSIKIFYSPNVENNRLLEARRVLHNCEFIPFSRSKERTGPTDGYATLSSNIHSIIQQCKIDVMHFARSGYYEWPFNARMAPVQVETNIFGYSDNSGFLDGSIIIGRCLGLSENPSRVLIPNPIPAPSPYYESLASLREELGINEEALVFGRIGRPANFTPIALEAFNEFRKHRKSKYIIIGPCDNARRFVHQKSMQEDVIFLDCTNDDSFIERFHKTIDVFAHYRSDGEICSTAISQAMMYGIPIITHTAGRNGQIEWLGDGGVYARTPQEYLGAMFEMTLKDRYVSMSGSAKTFAESNFNQRVVSLKVLEFYRHLMNQRSTP